MTDKVIFEELSAHNGKKIGYARLNKVRSLNALDLDMIQALMPQLLAWQNDSTIAAVLLDGEGDKAFCAGGDVVAMHDAMVKAPKVTPEAVEVFFSEEYRLDYLIHTFHKPFIVWGNGIVMGGGLGLLCGGSHRIVTESSRIAMPEISIGLYPDVGGSWFLNKMAPGVGLFLGLTGASINAMDALHVKLADHFIPHEQKAGFIEQLLTLPFGETVSLNHQKLTDLCQQYHQQHLAQLPAANVKPHEALIQQLTASDNIAQIYQAILNHDCGEDKWLARAQQTLNNGSALTACLVFEQLKRGASKTLAECFRMELIMSCRCASTGEFQEGVRALLIDKDQNPNWQYASVADVPAELVEHCFTSPWTDEAHPLKGIGK
ncbi:enoyl-CoA hydratase/isomerase family protein [Neptunicella marina]|uniref:3-hydroxyisobutyryl-CoA hydrolase n=1 Tax=Neptunicella marina TaxID=2125989 RepID=A0A8J6IRN5_9ALTE|nr:enoyl-CoA hydratase/isomerase family protein [Neptunicella marina]MBC3764612.1 enoyl-CoA hydratase/isomerase family protein [Neptunicella marina]